MPSCRRYFIIRRKRKAAHGCKVNRVSLIKFLLPANERHEPLVYTVSDWSANKCYFRLFGLPRDSARHFRRLVQSNYLPSNREERRSRKNFSGNVDFSAIFIFSRDASTRVSVIEFGFCGLFRVLASRGVFRAPLAPDSARINKRKFQLLELCINSEYTCVFFDELSNKRRETTWNVWKFSRCDIFDFSIYISQCILLLCAENVFAFPLKGCWNFREIILYNCTVINRIKRKMRIVKFKLAKIFIKCCILSIYKISMRRTGYINNKRISLNQGPQFSLDNRVYIRLILTLSLYHIIVNRRCNMYLDIHVLVLERS